ncbi:MAG: ATP-binding cassette domain-containing protein [Clostridia bacterium]|nr:ATP-binding cassette domain-containing protein [Clostridia bacterium]
MYIEIEGARIHNLKNIDVKIPKNKLTVITGVSGSGKSSLAFDLIYEEGKRRYLSFLDPLYSMNNTAAFNAVRNLAPTVAIEQRTMRLSNPRSTVATKTGLDTLLAMLFSEYGNIGGKELCGKNKSVEAFQRYSPVGMCGECYGAGKTYIVNEEMLFGDKNKPLHRVLGDESTKYQALYLFCQNHNLSYKQSIGSLSEEDFQIYKYGDRETNSFVGMIPWVINYYKKKSRTKSFNQSEFPFITYTDCPHCYGSGRGRIALESTIDGKNIVELEDMCVEDIAGLLSDCEIEESALLADILERLNCLTEINLGYLSLSRSIPTLSGGEIQRLCLANYIFTDIDSLVFVFDEPSIGLHVTEKRKLVMMLRRLIDKGNTVIVVEHDKEVVAAADYIVDIGPYAGKHGGECVYQGSRDGYDKCTESTTARYILKNDLIGNKNMKRLKNASMFISLENCSVHNLKNVSVKIPLGCLTGIAGVSGSGKSSLIEYVLIPKLKQMMKTDFIYADDGVLSTEELPEVKISGIENIKKCYLVSQKPMGKNNTSCVATVLGVFDRIRRLFADAIGMEAGMFSPNSSGGCPDCGGEGVIHYKVGRSNSVDFECQTCHGSGFADEALTVAIDGKNITEVLDMEVSQAIKFFENKDKSIHRKLCEINEFGLGYLRLGQKTATLSGGEAQRLKLSCEFGRSEKVKGNIYILDEPTTGLSMYDELNLIDLLQKIVDNGGTVIVSEHNTEFLSACDYLIELGPGGGKNGGSVIATGSLEELKANIKSVIGRFL